VGAYGSYGLAGEGWDDTGAYGSVVVVLAVYCDSPKYEPVEDVAGNLELEGPYGSLYCSGFGVRRAAFSEKPDVGA